MKFDNLNHTSSEADDSQSSEEERVKRRNNMRVSSAGKKLVVDHPTSKDWETNSDNFRTKGDNVTFHIKRPSLKGILVRREIGSLFEDVRQLNSGNQQFYLLDQEAMKLLIDTLSENGRKMPFFPNGNHKKGTFQTPLVNNSSSSDSEGDIPNNQKVYPLCAVKYSNPKPKSEQKPKINTKAPVRRNTNAPLGKNPEEKIGFFKKTFKLISKGLNFFLNLMVLPKTILNKLLGVCFRKKPNHTQS